jgi:hypothetical protein
MKVRLSYIFGSVLILLLSASCNDNPDSNEEMIGLLASIEKQNDIPDNPFSSETRLKFFDSALATVRNGLDSVLLELSEAKTLLESGNEERAVALCKNILDRTPAEKINQRRHIMKTLAIAYLRMGERNNCINDHSGQSCIFPISGRGIHKDKYASQKAIDLYTQILEMDTADHESKWLLNVAYMTTGGYPAEVPAKLLIAGLDKNNTADVKPFVDAAMNIGLNTNNLAGGSIVDDFNNDGYLDLITSSWGLKQGMHFCKNNADGSFTDLSDSSGIRRFTGGLNIMQTDYNNDGLKDIFVLRGGWKGRFGDEPNSLLRNNGDGSFTDVTEQSGLLSFHPTQTATWADFNNDGWLDIFIGNETSTDQEVHPCELYISNKNGTFTNMAVSANCAIIGFVKGVTSGDYDNDGLTDIFISTLNGKKILLRNETAGAGGVQFKDVSAFAGLDKNFAKTFPTWFWDYDNDGWLDILVCGYDFDRSLAWSTAREAMGIEIGHSGKQFLFRNKRDGTFEDVSEKVGLNKVAFAMGSNFGDIDNDGFLDIYLGTGNPQYQSLVPNKMFRNINGEKFMDITNEARVGNIQKGHGVSFADLDNDGDADIYIEMGGAYGGDAYQNSLYINPGQNNNNWVNILLEGTVSNRAGIGARIKVTVRDKGNLRSIFRDVNSGGSFGSNPLIQHIGIGAAEKIESVEITWPGIKAKQELKNLPVNENLKIKQGSKSFTSSKLKKLNYLDRKRELIGCSPADFLPKRL